MDTANRRGATVQSVDRAVSVMEFLSGNGWSGVTEVAERLGIHKSTAYRLLTTLRNRGLVEQDASTEKYRLGFGLVLLASAVTADLDVVRHAKPLCRELAEESGATVTISVLERDEAVVIHQSIPSSSVLSVDWSGRHTPLHATADGKVLLYHMPEERRERILSRPLKRFTENTIVDPEKLREQLEEVRSRGYAYTVEELEVGLNAVGVPICSASGGIAAMSISGPSFRLPPEALPELGREAAKRAGEISYRLGFRGVKGS